MNNQFIKAVSDVEEAVKDWKAGLLLEDEFRNKIYHSANILATIQEMEMRAEEENKISLQDLGQALGVI